MSTHSLRVLLTSLTLLAPAPAVADASANAATWPQWRGPARDGASPGTPWPDSLAGLELAWRVPAGKGYPGPIVAGDRVFLVESAADEAVVVRALARDTGKELWRFRWVSGFDVPGMALINGDWVRSTPAFDGATLFVGDMREVIVALDGQTGAERWKVDLPARFKTPLPEFGFASSPLADDGALYLQAAASVVKLDAKTGATLWRSLVKPLGKEADGVFSSPMIATLAGVRQLVVLERTALHGLALDSGAVLWTQAVPAGYDTNVTTPLVVGDGIFVAPYGENSALYRVARQGERFTVAPAWTNKASGYMSSPVVVDGHAFLHLGNGRVDCIDLATGESRWRSEALGKYWSMVERGGKVLGLAENGKLYLLRGSTAAFTLLAERQLTDQETWGHLAAAGDQLFVRELEGLAVWRWAAAPAAPKPTTN